MATNKHTSQHSSPLIQVSIAFACSASVLSIISRPAITKATPIASITPSSQAIPAKAITPTLEVRLQGTDLYNAIVKEVSRDVEKRVEQQNQENLKSTAFTASGILAILSFAGFRTFLDFQKKLKSEVKSDIREEIEKYIASEFKDRLSVLAKELSYYRLLNLAGRIEAGRFFSDIERDAVLESLNQLSDEQSITSRAEFISALERIIDAFYVASLDLQIDAIEAMFLFVILKSPGIVLSLVNHYGSRVLGDIEEDADTVNRFHKYVEACKSLRLYGRALPYIMVLEYQNKRQGWEKRIEAFFQDLDCLELSDKEAFRLILMRNSDINEVCSTPTGSVIRLTQSFHDFIDAYIDKLSNYMRTTAVQDSAKPS